MSDRELRAFEGRAKAAIIAGFAAWALAFVGVWVQVRQNNVAIPMAMLLGFPVAIMCGAAAVAGVTAKSSGLAAVFGALIFAVSATAFLLLFRAWIPNQTWFLIAACAIGTFCSQVGAIAGNIMAKREEDTPLFASLLMNFCVLCVALAVYFWYVIHLPLRL